MKVLFVSAVLPYPLRSGGQIRMYNLLKRLGEKHEISLLSFIRKDEENAFLKKLSFLRKTETVYRGGAWQPRYLASSVLGKFPFLLSTYQNRLMQEKISMWLSQEKFDLIHIEPFYVWPSLPSSAAVPLVIGEHNIEYEVYTDYIKHYPIVPIRPFLGLDVVKLRFWEEAIWRKARAITAVSLHDKDVIETVQRNVTLVPNGVDLAEFPYKESRPKQSGPIILFVGDFKWFPNHYAIKDLLRNIWPLIKQKFSGSRLRIIGRSLPDDLIRESRDRGAEVAEDVEDIGAEYRSADILAAPIRIAGGTKFKILEAMASGLPVITTKEGIEGLVAENNVDYLQAQTPMEFIDQIHKILDSERFRFMIIRNARKRIEDKYSWDSIAKILDTVWRQTHEEAH